MAKNGGKQEEQNPWGDRQTALRPGSISQTIRGCSKQIYRNFSFGQGVFYSASQNVSFLAETLITHNSFLAEISQTIHDCFHGEIHHNFSFNGGHWLNLLEKIGNFGPEKSL